jgi:type II secretory pathway pseudopilin PulG
VRDRRGFALLEVLIAAGLLMALAAGASRIVAMAVRQGHASRARTMATLLASAKMEELRSLAWTHVTAGDPPMSFPWSDTTTDLSRTPATDGGPGLLESPSSALETNTPSCVDFLDEAGAWVGTGISPPASAVYIRRWMVQALRSDPDNILVLHVFVTTRDGSTTARLATLRSRR